MTPQNDQPEPDQMRNLQRRLNNLEAVLTDPVRVIPHTQKWLEYWDRQFYLYLTGQDQDAIWYSSIDAYRAVMKYSQESKGSLVGKHYGGQALCRKPRVECSEENRMTGVASIELKHWRWHSARLCPGEQTVVFGECVVISQF